MSSREKQWYAVYTLYRHEKKVGEKLQKMGIESFVPVQKEIRRWSDRKKIVENVVIPMMVFVHIHPSHRTEVLSVPSVSRFMVVRGEHIPVVIPDYQLEKFKFMLGYTDSPIDFTQRSLSVGESVKVIRGPLKGLEGVLVKIDKESKIYINLNLLGSVGVEIDSSSVEKLK